VYLTILATAIWVLHAQLGWAYDRRFAAALGALNLVLAVAVFWLADRGRIVSGSMSRKAA
jgi:hypothetical protein